MIVNFKIFENVKDSTDLDYPMVGDYVYCYDTTEGIPEFDEFLNNNIGKIIKIEHFYYVEFENFEELLNMEFNHPVNFQLKEIIFWSKNKEHVEAYIAAKKYNL